MKEWVTKAFGAVSQEHIPYIISDPAEESNNQQNDDTSNKIMCNGENDGEEKSYNMEDREINSQRNMDMENVEVSSSSVEHYKMHGDKQDEERQETHSDEVPAGSTDLNSTRLEKHGEVHTNYDEQINKMEKMVILGESTDIIHNTPEKHDKEHSSTGHENEFSTFNSSKCVKNANKFVQCSNKDSNGTTMENHEIVRDLTMAVLEIPTIL